MIRNGVSFYMRGCEGRIMLQAYKELLSTVFKLSCYVLLCVLQKGEKGLLFFLANFVQYKQMGCWY